jgi:hypothetical protein
LSAGPGEDGAAGALPAPMTPGAGAVPDSEPFPRSAIVDLMSFMI